MHLKKFGLRFNESRRGCLPGNAGSHYIITETDAEIDDEPFRRFRHSTISGQRKMLPEDKLLSAMKSDKKVIDNTFRFVLLNNWQQPVVKSVNEKELIHKAWLTVYRELQ